MAYNRFMAAVLARIRSTTSTARWFMVLSLCIVATVIVGSLNPIPQSQAYHAFADQRTIGGIPHALDVLSNLPFLVAGLMGLGAVAWVASIAKTGSVLNSEQKITYGVLFAGLILTAFGSGYYHLAPDNHRLVADRLPMTIAMAGFIGALVADRFGSLALWFLPALLAVGLGSVIGWSMSEQHGHGDLRWYALYQGLTMIVGAALLVLFPSQQIGTREFVIAVIGNVAAKIFEALDKPIFLVGGVVSGHTLKHLSAGLGFLPLVFLILTRAHSVRQETLRDRSRHVEAKSFEGA
ncbi:MAG TPA: alkaline phytoceramidase [Candidatus Angelobacter sp.]|nr:alkaline phytoceramidase [Candidatus Angelobacter sp.]